MPAALLFMTACEVHVDVAELDVAEMEVASQPNETAESLSQAERQDLDMILPFVDDPEFTSSDGLAPTDDTASAGDAVIVRPPTTFAGQTADAVSEPVDGGADEQLDPGNSAAGADAEPPIGSVPGILAPPTTSSSQQPDSTSSTSNVPTTVAVPSTSAPSTEVPTTVLSTSAPTTVVPTTVSPVGGAGPWDPPATNGPIVVLSDFMRSGQPGQTAEFQRALAAAAGGRLVIPPGIWMVAGQLTNHGTLIPAANTTVEIQAGAVVQQETATTDSLKLFRLDNANVHLRGRGTIRGELSTRTVNSGEHNFLVLVTRGATNWSIVGPTIEESWGDGIYVGGIHSTGPVIGGVIDHVTLDDNRRQGISVTWSEGLVIGDDVVLSNTGQLAKSRGFARQGPTAGLDVEPNQWSWVDNLTVGSVIAENNIGGGFIVQSPFNNETAWVTFNGSIARNNGDPGGSASYRRGGREGGQATLNNVVAENNAGHGVAVTGSHSPARTFQGRINASGGRSDNNDGAGWLLANDASGGSNVLDGVSASGNAQGGIVERSGSGNVIR